MPRKVITKRAIREFRKSKEMSQEKFAEYMGVSVHTIRSWEETGRSTNIPNRLLSDPRTSHLAEEFDDE